LGLKKVICRFELDVIPENYIDQAPKDLELVGKNWTMVRELLDIISSYDSKDQNKHEVLIFFLSSLILHFLLSLIRLLGHRRHDDTDG